MKKVILIVAIIFTSLGVKAQEDEVLMTINGKDIKCSEFMYIYQKNNVETSIEPKSMDEYLDLFINFKLKVCQAEVEGIDTTAAFLQELKGYRAQATPKYLQDHEAIDSLIEMSYQRMAHPRRAAHIAIECPISSSDSAKEAAMKLISDLRERATIGAAKTIGKGKKAVVIREKEDFLTLAKQYSTDPSLSDNGGDLGLIQPFRYIYSFEDAVYNTPVGEVTPIFQSPYGYHVALVEGEENFEEVHAGHIMKMVPKNSDSTLCAKKKAEIDSLYALVKAGADFEQTALKNSDDKGSALRGGDLNWFTHGMMVKPFEDAAFSLKYEGEISEPIQSRFGWHIIKLYEHRGIQPLDSMRSQIRKQVMRDERSKIAAESFIRKTRQEYQLPDTMSDANVRQYADAHLEEKHADFRNLVTEYHDGILLFDTSLKNVWDKASHDEEGLEKYFQKHKKEYTWNAPRYKGYIIYAKNQAAANQAKSIIKSASCKDSIESYIDHRINTDSVQYVRVEKGLWKKGEKDIIDQKYFKDKSVKVVPDRKFPITLMVGKMIAKPQEYSDERGQVTSDYQDELEQAWVESLRNTYPVVVNQEVFERLKQSQNQK